MTTARLEEVERPDRVNVKVVERPARRQVVTRLRGSMNDQFKRVSTKEFIDGGAIADIQIDVTESLAGRLQALAIPGRVTLLAKEIRAHVVVEARDVGIPSSSKNVTASDPIRPLLPVTNTAHRSSSHSDIRRFKCLVIILPVFFCHPVAGPRSTCFQPPSMPGTAGFQRGAMDCNRQAGWCWFDKVLRLGLVIGLLDPAVCFGDASLKWRSWSPF